MKVKIKYFGLLRNKVGKKEEDFTLKRDAYLSDLLEKLRELYGEEMEDLLNIENENSLDPTLLVTVNGITTDLKDGTRKKLNENDTIALLTLISGG